MKSSGDRITQRDVTFWGVAALVCGSIAVLAGNLGGALPSWLVAHLHATRLSGANLSQMQVLVAQTRQQTAELAAQFDTVESRLDFIDRGTTEMVRRVAAVESSVPLLIEALPFDSDIDRTLLTAAIGGDAEALEEVEGGLLALRRRPLLPDTSGEGGDQPMPPLPDSQAAPSPEGETAGTDPLTTATISSSDTGADDAGRGDPGPAGAGMAIGLGPVADAEAARALWDALGERAGPLLLGLEPRLAGSGGDLRLLAGPLMSEAAAQTICERLEMIGSACAPAPLEGEPLSPTP